MTESNNFDVNQILLESRQVFLCGEVNENNTQDVTSKLLMLNSLNHDPIHLYINSIGGCVSSGLAIYDVMKLIQAPVYTYCVGQACSMAAIILAGGTKRYGLKHSTVMIHQPSGGVEGTADEIKIDSKEMNRIHNTLLKILAKETKKKISEVKVDIQTDKFMSAIQALKYGLIDEIIGNK